ncbi:MAG: 50S ribosomal protein L22 [Patescibacteria group bacterium]|jgi:large subunit ribosomal protein L22
MEVVAYQKFVRTSPRKLRLVADSVRGLHPTKALINLQFMHKRAAETLRKVMKQAVSNAVNNMNINEQNLKTKHILVEEGPVYKRFRAASRGRARMIMKRTSHIKVVLEGKEEVKKTKQVKKA